MVVGIIRLWSELPVSVIWKWNTEEGLIREERLKDTQAAGGVPCLLCVTDYVTFTTSVNKLMEAKTKSLSTLKIVQYIHE